MPFSSPKRALLPSIFPGTAYFLNFPEGGVAINLLADFGESQQFVKNTFCVKMTSIRLSLGGDDNQEKEKDANAQLMELDKGNLQYFASK